MNELALCLGACGAALGSRLAGNRIVCAVERDPYRQACILARQADGCLDPFPIWSDLRDFDGRPWRGIVDVVTAGDPCQHDSNCHRSGHTAECYGHEVVRIVSECMPTYVVRENPARQRTDAAWSHVRMRDALRCLGYAAECVRLRACCLGGDHQRSRVFVLAKLAYSHGERVAFREALIERSEAPSPVARGILVADAGSDFFGGSRSTDVDPDRMDRLAALGDGQVPAVVRVAWRLLMEE